MSVRAWRALGLVAFALFTAYVLIGRLLDPRTYPSGDPRNEPAFWVAVALLGLVLVTLVLVAAAREVRSRR
jgi:hypothetical protein